LRIHFLASENWGTYLGLSEIGENKKEKAELEKEMERTSHNLGILMS